MKVALCAGCNYIGTEYELRGCLNDVDTWARLFGEHGVAVSALKETQATRAALLHGLNQMIGELKAGDTAYFTWSGHGTWTYDKGGDEPDGRDEAICPIDMGDGSNLIIDDEFDALFRKIPSGAHLVLLADSCHSGTLYRSFPSPGVTRKPRFLPPAHFLPGASAVEGTVKAYSLPLRSRTDAPLAGVIHFSACKDAETASDAVIANHPCGAFTYFAANAFRATAAAGGSYEAAYQIIRKHLPSSNYQQTPLLNAVSADKKLILFR